MRGGASPDLPVAPDADDPVAPGSRRGAFSDPQRGHTLLELSIALVVLSVGMIILYDGLGRATSHTGQSRALVEADGSARLALARLTDLVAESSFDSIDTTRRFKSGTSIFDSDRFLYTGLSHCTSAVCGFHTRPNLSVITRNRNCGFEYRTGLGTVSQVLGKTWASGLPACEFDGAPLADFGYLDVLKLFVSRAPDGTFTTVGGAPAWTGLVFVAPYPVGEGRCELRRYEMHVSDLAVVPPVSSNWTRWDPLAPDMIDLFDFGTDGTVNGVLDGSVPVTAVRSDATYEVFLTVLWNGELALMIDKRLNSPGVYPYRRVLMFVRLRDGRIDFTGEFYESASSWWVVGRSFFRAPTTLLTDVTEFAVSTSRSHPFDAMNNPAGVSEDNLVRITVGTSRYSPDRGNAQWQHAVDTFSVRTRN